MDLKELNDNIKQEQAFEEMMKEKYPDGYTPAQEAAEWGKRNRSDLGLWMENKKKGLYNMIVGGDKGAHSAIDSKISKNDNLFNQEVVKQMSDKVKSEYSSALAKCDDIFLYLGKVDNHLFYIRDK